MNDDEVKVMKVITGHRIEEFRIVDYEEQDEFGRWAEVPVLRVGEEVRRTLSGEVHIIRVK